LTAFPWPASAGAADAGDLHDITNIEEAPPPPPGPRWTLWALGIGGVVVVGGLALAGWGLARRRSRTAGTVPPERWALDELARIGGLGLPAAGQFERYHTLVSDVIRHYLELRFGFHAPEQTTTEFLASARRSPQLTAEQQAVLRGFLERCDLVKFAGTGSTVDECSGVAALARGFVEQTAASPG
jgi:hypothetical protein